MRWQGGRQSDNVEDRRGRGAPMMVTGGLGTLVIIVLALLFGVNPMALLEQGGAPGGAQVQQGAPGEEGAAPANDEASQFVRTVLASTEDVWRELFEQMGRTYRDPTLVMFSGQVNSACGMASAAVGPFYCPADEKVYLDVAFFRQLDEQFGAPGDFAQAYVIAHEIGHHVQNQLGTSDQVHQARGRVSEAEYNQLSVRLELQADFYAGVWAHHAQQRERILEPGDLEEALRAATAIGDDRLQKQSQGYVVPDSFTHGTSEQRMRWFRKGFQTGDMRQGDTFRAAEL